MSLVGFHARNHRQQVLFNGPDVDVDDRGTPPEFFDVLHRRYRFTVDAAAFAHNAKLERYWTPEDDGLSQSWDRERVWCNPPYSDIGPWVRKALQSDADLVVMLLPANRTEQRWWQDHIEPVRDRAGGPRCEFLRGRLRFVAPGGRAVGPDERPPFGCCLLIWGER